MLRRAPHDALHSAYTKPILNVTGQTKRYAFGGLHETALVECDAQVDVHQLCRPHVNENVGRVTVAETQWLGWNLWLAAAMAADRSVTTVSGRCAMPGQRSHNRWCAGNGRKERGHEHF